MYIVAPYSQDLASLDFWVLPKIKERSGVSFNRVQDLARAVNQKLKQHKFDWFQDCFKTWIRRLHKCIEHNGDYIEGTRF